MVAPSKRVPKRGHFSSWGLIRLRMGLGWRTDIAALPQRINLHLPHPEEWTSAFVQCTGLNYKTWLICTLYSASKLESSSPLSLLICAGNYRLRGDGAVMGLTADWTKSGHSENIHIAGLDV